MIRRLLIVLAIVIGIIFIPYYLGGWLLSKSWFTKDPPPNVMFGDWIIGCGVLVGVGAWIWLMHLGIDYAIKYIKGGDIL